MATWFIKFQENDVTYRYEYFTLYFNTLSLVKKKKETNYNFELTVDKDSSVRICFQNS